MAHRGKGEGSTTQRQKTAMVIIEAAQTEHQRIMDKT